jgi:hypothetical protein
MALVLLTAFLFLAIVSGIAGLMIEAPRAGEQGALRNPAVRDALWVVPGWATVLATHFAVELVGPANLTLEFRHLLGALVVLPFYHAALATLRLIYVSARRIYAHLRGGVYQPRPIPFLEKLAAPVLLIATILGAITEWTRAGASIYFFLFASIAALLVFIRKRAPQPQ